MSLYFLPLHDARHNNVHVHPRAEDKMLIAYIAASSLIWNKYLRTCWSMNHEREIGAGIWILKVFVIFPSYRYFNPSTAKIAMRSQTLFKKYALIKKRNRNQTLEKDNRRMQQRDIRKENFRLTVSFHTLFSGIYDIGTKVSSSLVTSRLTEGKPVCFLCKSSNKAR